MVQNSNKKIAKNSLCLFARTFFSVIVSLYTSRVFLYSLGVEDFGIYNLVGGIIALFAVVQNLLASSTQRFLNINIGKGDVDGELRIFNISITINILLILIVFLLSETIGSWVLLKQLSIPENKRMIAFIAYQLSVFTTLINIYRVTYIAKIIAHEEMSAFAYFSVFETVAKLGITLMLTYFLDRLVAYCVLLLLLSFVLLWMHIYFCNKRIDKNTYKFYNPFRYPEYKEMISFSVWTLIGNGASVGRDQGFAMLFNVFYGVVLNAAIGIVTQISNVFSSLFSNVQTAFMPQIVQNSQTNGARFAELLDACCIFSIVLMGYACIPLIINVQFVLDFWLGNNVPEPTYVFVQIIMVKILIVSFSQVFNLALMSVGNIASSQKIFLLVAALTLICAYGLLTCGITVIIVFSLIAVMDIIMLFVRLYILLQCTSIRMSDLMRSFIAFTFVLVICCPFAFFLSSFGSSWTMFITSIFMYIGIFTSVVYAFILKKVERDMINSKIKLIFKKT